jgi:hypothetical protein
MMSRTEDEGFLNDPSERRRRRRHRRQPPARESELGHDRDGSDARAVAAATPSSCWLDGNAERTRTCSVPRRSSAHLSVSLFRLNKVLPSYRSQLSQRFFGRIKHPQDQKGRKKLRRRLSNSSHPTQRVSALVAHCCVGWNLARFEPSRRADRLSNARQCEKKILEKDSL